MTDILLLLSVRIRLWATKLPSRVLMFTLWICRNLHCIYSGTPSEVSNISVSLGHCQSNSLKCFSYCNLTAKSRPEGETTKIKLILHPHQRTLLSHYPSSAGEIQLNPANPVTICGRMHANMTSGTDYSAWVQHIPTACRLSWTTPPPPLPPPPPHTHTHTHSLFSSPLVSML